MRFCKNKNLDNNLVHTTRFWKNKNLDNDLSAHDAFL